MADQFIYSMTDTWNNGATTYASIKMDVTDTGSASGSTLIYMLIDSADRFKVDKNAHTTLTSEVADATAGPVLTLYRNSASPAASDIMGKLLFQGEDSAGNTEDYAEIYTSLVDPTSTSEDASVLFRTKIAGTMTTRWTISSTGSAFTGRVDGPDGTVGAPVYTFTSDTDNGLYRIGADNPAFAAGGPKVWEATASLFTVALAAQFNNTVTLTSTDAGATAGPSLDLYRNSASPAASDVIGRIRFQGEDSAGNTEDYAELYASITDPTSTSEDASLLLRNKVAGTMTTQVTLDASGAQFASAPRVGANTIWHAGNDGSGSGLDADTVDGEHYEEGTWTPVLAFGGASTGITYSEQTGTYRRIGSLIIAGCQLTLSSKGTATGSATITGLPYTVEGTEAVAATRYANMSSGNGLLVSAVTGGTALTCRLPGAAATGAAIDTTFTNSSLVYFVIAYQATT